MENFGKCEFCTIWGLSVDGIIIGSWIMLQWQNIWPDHRLSLVSVDSDCLCCCSTTERLQLGYFEFLSACECLAESSAIIFPTEGPHCCFECFLSLCLGGAEELYQLAGKKASLLQADNPQ